MCLFFYSLFRNLIEPFFQDHIALKKSGFQVQMSNPTLLKTPYWNILNRELKAEVKSMRIRQILQVFLYTRIKCSCVAKMGLTNPILEVKEVF